ncbi:MAG: NADH:ubiquinone reductase (Na(+)-transporting) subunit C [Bacteroidales bacterium]|jgi:Na+-transporting NADH:ubiquinone oxidoreductase subunit C|nr:NADH:ubiquinone reductase (Na(+)-transporting) subunit C [Bacteroidales bacterium]
MKNFSNRYIFIYITVLVAIVAVLVSVASVSLQPRQEANRLQERYSQILLAAGYPESEVMGKEVIQLYKTVAEEMNIDSNLLVIKVKTTDGTEEYIIPVKGKGLWGPIWGFIAIGEDGNTVKGAIFAHKGETPGLGAEITTPKFTNEFVGKQIFDEEGNFVSIKVVKGGVVNSNVPPLHGVDAISGGTVTSTGVDKMLQNELSKYVPFLKSLQK